MIEKGLIDKQLLQNLSIQKAPSLKSGRPWNGQGRTLLMVLTRQATDSYVALPTHEGGQGGRAVILPFLEIGPCVQEN